MFVFDPLFAINSTSSGIYRNKLINNIGSVPYLTRSYKLMAMVYLFENNGEV